MISSSLVELKTLTNIKTPLWPLKQVDYAVSYPDEESKTVTAKKYPLLLYLHGGGSSRDYLKDNYFKFTRLMNEGLMPKCIVASFSTYQGGGSYMDFHDGKTMYETFFMEEWLPHLQATYPVNPSRETTWICGISMGGCGSLKFTFKYPEKISVCCALEPFIDPCYLPKDLKGRNLLFRQNSWNGETGQKSLEVVRQKKTDDKVVEDFTGIESLIRCHGAIDVNDWDEKTYINFNPASIVLQNLANIQKYSMKGKNLKIYIECADTDFFNLHDGAEFLHNTLWKYRIPHEYHLCMDADHLGETIHDREAEAYRWLGKMAFKILGSPIKNQYNTLTPGQMETLKRLQQQASSSSVTLHDGVGGGDGEEPISSMHNVMLEMMRAVLPQAVKQHFKPLDGWGRLPESDLLSNAGKEMMGKDSSRL